MDVVDPRHIALHGLHGGDLLSEQIDEAIQGVLHKSSLVTLARCVRKALVVPLPRPAVVVRKQRAQDVANLLFQVVLGRGQCALRCLSSWTRSSSPPPGMGSRNVKLMADSQLRQLRATGAPTR